MSHGFHSLEDAGLERTIRRYETALSKYYAGEINYPCGESARKVQRWLDKAREELQSRRAMDKL